MSDSRLPLRLWPGVAAALLLIILRWFLPAVAPDDFEVLGMNPGFVSVVGALFCAVGVVFWWLFFSRAPWRDRLGALAVMALAIVAVRPLTHISIQNGMMGMMFFIWAVPATLSLAFVGWAIVTRQWAARPRRAAMVAAIVAGSGVWMLARTNGISSGGVELEWRWTPTAEERLLASEPDAPTISLPAPVTASAPAPSPAAKPTAAIAQGDASEVPAAPPPEGDAVEDAAGDVGVAGEARVEHVEWPGFRGHERDGVVRAVRIDTDWDAAPPVEVWRRPVGPGWSSFAVGGDLLYTQEQRGDDELVACYRVSTGEPVWQHRDAVRFWESNGGAGPRATPTLHGGRVYAFGATGLLNVLDAATGQRIWSRDVATDTARRIPDWGFASSPLVIDDVVIVAASGTLAAYDLATGAPRWQGPSYGGSYSSPHRVVIEGVVHVVLLGGPGAIGVAPDTGAVLWEHSWSPGPIVQPAVLPGGDLLINTLTGTGGMGTRRLRLTQTSGQWRIDERWTSRGLKPYFNDFVVHKGHAYGFDGNILSSIDLEDGERRWKGGRYGNGQMVLLADQDLLLVLSEDGELVLVSATPDAHTEIARFPALDAKTWNHPVLVGDTLLVRNGEQMASFRLALVTR